MHTSSKGIAFLLSVAISATVMVILLPMETASTRLIFTVGGLMFLFSFILLAVALEVLIFREINNIYRVMDKIKKKDLKKLGKKSKRASLFPLRKINDSIHAYADAKNKEIEALQKNDTFRREFIANISHELKTPIFAAQGYVHTLMDGAIDDQQVRDKFLKRAAKNLNVLDTLVQDLLTLNKMESGVVKFHFEEFDLPDLIQEQIEQLEQKAEKKKMTIKLAYDRKKAYLAFADKDKISQALRNLLANAIKYNSEGGKVDISVKKTPKFLRIRVKDNGQGIPQEDLNRIFERFYRVEKSRSREKGGTGLGLAIVKHILEGHKSKVSVVSTVGKGSVFSFTLPLAKEGKKSEIFSAQA